MLDKIKQFMDGCEYATALTDRNWNGGPYLLYVNKNWERMTGYTLEEVKWKNPKLLQGPKTNKADLAGIRESLMGASDTVYTGGTWNHKKGGKPFRVHWIIYNVEVLEDYYLAIQRDVTHIAKEDLTLNEIDQVRVLIRMVKMLYGE